MITLRKAADRFHTRIGWLDSRHTFSFGEHHDPRHMGFRSLRVINDDRVQPGNGFPPHPHRDMEIISYALEGGLAHEDSMGNGSVIRPGDVQRMSAGTGVVHSEWNASESELVHFLQIWIIPERRGIPAGYEQKSFPPAEGLRLVASRDGREGSVTIHQDAELWAGLVSPGKSVTRELRPGRYAWLHVARGAVRLNDTPMGSGDGAAISDETRLEITGVEPAELLFFDLA
jgi:quercetin 2,3-dioxygenase